MEKGHAILEKWLKGTLYLKTDFDSKESFTVYYMVTDILFWMLQFMTEMKETAFIMQNVSPRSHHVCFMPNNIT